MTTTLLALSRAIEARDPHSSGHAARVGVMAEVVAERLGWDEADVEVLRIGAALHDVGKLRVPERILRKPGPLDDDELAEMRRHPRRARAWSRVISELQLAVPAVLYHHERWDGTGYPMGIEGEAIPAEARVLAVVDAFDAMTTDRSYRRALPRRWRSPSSSAVPARSSTPRSCASSSRPGGTAPWQTRPSGLDARRHRLAK